MNPGWQIVVLGLCAGLGLFALTAYRRARDARRCGACRHWGRIAYQCAGVVTGVCDLTYCARAEDASGCSEWQEARHD